MKNKIINLTKDLMSFKTYKDNKEEFSKLFKYIKDKYKKLNIIEKEFNNNKCLILSNKNTKVFDVVFCCHVDVVFSDNFKISEDKDNIYGRGSIDMKGGCACSLEALNNYKGNKKIGVIFTSDEEIDGYCCKKILEEYSSSLAIIPDGGKDFALIMEEKGLLQLELSIKTKSSHASQPWNGINAIDELYKVYLELLKKYPLPKNSSDYKTSINLGKISGGNSFNSVADNCIMSLDIRYTSDTNKDEIINYIKKINNNVNISIILESNIFKCDINNKMISKYISICNNILNKDIDIIGCETSSDAVYFSDKDIPTIIMNPIGDFPHGEKEFVNKDSLVNLYNIYNKFLESLDE